MVKEFMNKENATGKCWKRNSQIPAKFRRLNLCLCEEVDRIKTYVYQGRSFP